jgi:rhamnose utilization protein RhaD (predicted bifunctional aldolase and dehydrogenase)
VLWVPYIRPGFPLSKLIAEAMRQRPAVRAVFMATHGLVTWGETAVESYGNTLEFIGRAEDYIRQQTGNLPVLGGTRFDPLPVAERRALMASVLPKLRGMLSAHRPMIVHYDDSDAVLAFVNAIEAKTYALAGTACPDHLVHTKSVPLWVEAASLEPDALVEQLRAELEPYRAQYGEYYEREHARAGDNFPMDDPSPRIILIPRVGMIATGKDVFWARTAGEIYQRAMAVIRGRRRRLRAAHRGEDYDVGGPSSATS